MCGDQEHEQELNPIYSKRIYDSVAMDGDNARRNNGGPVELTNVTNKASPTTTNMPQRYYGNDDYNDDAALDDYTMSEQQAHQEFVASYGYLHHDQQRQFNSHHHHHDYADSINEALVESPAVSKQR